MSIEWINRAKIDRDCFGIGIVEKRWRSKCRRFILFSTKDRGTVEKWKVYKLNGDKIESLFSGPSKTFRTRKAVETFLNRLLKERK